MDKIYGSNRLHSRILTVPNHTDDTASSRLCCLSVEDLLVAGTATLLENKMQECLPSPELATNVRENRRDT
jgi:hypothetical protein